MSAVQITKDNFDEVVLNAAKPVLVDFWAPWCGPCQTVLPLVEELAQRREDAVIGKINVDEEPELAKKFRIMSIPTLMVFRGGESVRRVSGALSREELEALLEE